ncbi:N-terminal acetyltransferase A, auxiliary subunit [Metschnikowia bicuspidata]|uniref:N-terminal acetyltransferase A, auxiliary subunit n=1 Tax=Metschnikowia bicuspidata TaxID=27322 RepID=A0A4P9ZFZ5_9ASCO|nr:N-terminal acetyltransferase A, auxiliary subunit [Metschnikowia bicuspidata]
MSRRPIFANKEDANAREALVLYEAKKYKKALKLVDQNLKKNFSHAESLALKGVTNYQLGHKQESESYILKALKKGSKNYLVNHLAGIYYRNVENYPEAAKWYNAAVDNGSQNTPILRDLALLQLQIRDYKNLRTCRQRYAESQPQYRANWTAVAVADHLNKDYDAAFKTLSKIEGIIKPHLQEPERYEQSECSLYKVQIITEAGNIARALEELEADTDDIRDRLAFLEYKAKFLLLLGKLKEASIVYRQLLQRNPDNAFYYESLETALGTTAAPLEIRLKLYDRLALFYPRADPPQYLPLTFLPTLHPEFRKRASLYVLSQLKRGVPAAFVNVKPLYKNAKKAAVILSVVQDFYQDIKDYPPPVYVSANYFFAQHYLHFNNLEKAIGYINTALDHSPILAELYIVKARIYKHMGDFNEANSVMQKGRSLDLQDRFINSKATKYLLRANKVEEAIDCVSMFSKLDRCSINGLKDLHTMQSNWILVESAEAYARKYAEQKALLQSESHDAEEQAEIADMAELYLGLALKRFYAILNVFKVYVNDQFDYHSYCMRKGTPRDYIDMIRWEDNIHSTPIYVRAIKGLSTLLWQIRDRSSLADDEETSGKDKKKRNIKKTRQLNIKKKSELIAIVESVTNDQDPLGQVCLGELRESGAILEKLEVYVKQLSLEAANYVFTWDLSFKLYSAERKYVLALQALKSWAARLDPQQKKTKVVGNRVIDFQSTLTNDTTSNAAIVKATQKGLESAFPELANGQQEFSSVYCN